MNIESRHRILVNTDPQRRCYNGCHAKLEFHWSDWGVLEYDVKDPERRMQFWTELNALAVQDRGPGAERQFRIGLHVTPARS